MDTFTSSDPADASWRPVYRIAALSALVVVAMILLGIVTFLLWPMPLDGTVEAWLELYARSPLRGMIAMDATMFVSFLAQIPLAIALYEALRRDGEGLAALGATVLLVAIVTYLASSRMFEMLALSTEYAAATDAVRRATLVAAAQSMLTTYLGPYATTESVAGIPYQGTAFNVSYVLSSIGALLLSLVMRRSAVFGRAIGTLGAIASVVSLAYFVPSIGALLSVLALPALLAWYVMLALRLWRLGGAERLG
jgi:hypothetical protein